MPSQIYSAAAKYIWLYIPECDGFWKINHISWYLAKCIRRQPNIFGYTSLVVTRFGKSITFLYAQPKQIGAPVAHQTKTKRLKTKTKEPFLKKTVVLLNNGSWKRLDQLLSQPNPAATDVMKKNVLIFAQLCVFLAQVDDKDLGHMGEVETPSQVDMRTSPTKSHSCSPWPWLWHLWMPSLRNPTRVRVGNKSSCMSLYVKYNCFPIVYACSLLTLKSVLCGPEDIQSRADICRGKDFLKLLLILELWGLLAGRQPRHPMFESQDLQWDSWKDAHRENGKIMRLDCKAKKTLMLTWPEFSCRYLS